LADPRLLSRLAGALLFLHRATLRVERVHFDRYLGLKARGVPILFALWHGRMFLSIQAHRGEGIVTMASRSEDGEIIAGWLERNGYSVVRGSTTRGGSEALREMVRRIRSGRSGALTEIPVKSLPYHLATQRGREQDFAPLVAAVPMSTDTPAYAPVDAIGTVPAAAAARWAAAVALL